MEKEDLVSKKNTPKNRRKRNSRTPWKLIQRKLSERTIVVKVSPKNTSRSCPRCGFTAKTRVGKVLKCTKCGFELNRQKPASINIYLKYAKMWGNPHSNDLDMWMKGELWVGITPNRWSTVVCTPDEEGCRGLI